ncbi:hypothetical protein BU16DRAFT_392970 [Lophium mytilinum]|uniref:Uncharacterized protein n=1 Tax=Lophium mytilinum TaxID=390894 RepID=A0A6A6QTP0_9PEZI|nr:hypothetical protein BU16DRAFT_392970 [Lophium mytilinum]
MHQVVNAIAVFYSPSLLYFFPLCLQFIALFFLLISGAQLKIMLERTNHILNFEFEYARSMLRNFSTKNWPAFHVKTPSASLFTQRAQLPKTNHQHPPTHTQTG